MAEDGGTREESAPARPLSKREIKGLIVFGVLFSALVFLFIRFISAIAAAVLLFVLVVLFTLVLSPFVTWLEQHKIPRYVSSVSLAAALLGLIGVISWQAYPVLSHQFSSLFKSLPGYINKIQDWLADQAPFLGFKHVLPGGGQSIAAISQSAGSLLLRISSYTVSALEVVAGILMVFVGTIYALASPRPLLENFLRLLGPQRAYKAAEILQQLSVQQRKWAYATLAAMFAIFILVWIGLGLIIRMPFALLFAAIAGILEVVPVLGPLAAAIPPCTVALGISPMLFVWTVLTFLVIHQIENHVIVPIVLGRGAQLHPISVIFAVAVLGSLYGIIGIFLAVPAAVTAKILLEELYFIPREQHGNELSEKVEPIVSGEEQEDDKQGKTPEDPS